jgi:myo-inositol-1(or 4)-monophosphatase
MVFEYRHLSRMLEVAVVSARLGGQRAMELVNYSKASVKNNNELVTEADKQCQQIIIDRIKENYPDHGFIGEEGTGGKLFKQPPRSSDGSGVWWVIDPIDGTTNFAHRILCFSVSIAVMYEGESIVGAVFDPTTDSMFTAVKGGDAQFNSTRIAVNEDSINEFACFGIDSNLESSPSAGIAEMMRKTRFRNLGSLALQLAYVAKGSLISTTDTKAKLWDIAAGAFIVEQAGGIVTNWQGEKIWPMDLEKYNGEKFRILAANKKVHGEILGLLNPSQG